MEKSAVIGRDNEFLFCSGKRFYSQIVNGSDDDDVKKKKKMLLKSSSLKNYVLVQDVAWSLAGVNVQ